MSDFIKSPLLICHSKKFYKAITLQIKNSDEIEEYRSMDDKVREVVKSLNFATVLLNNFQHLHGTRTDLSCFFDNDSKAAEEYFYDACAKVLKVKILLDKLK
jgi:hypothetical protein